VNSNVIKVPFFREGKWLHPKYGALEGTQEKFNAIIDNFHRNVAGRPPFIRLGHAKDGALTFGDAPAEAWVYDIIQEGPVLYALAHPTNENVVEAIKTKRYRFASPEYEEQYTNKENGEKVGPTLLAIGLTNEPFLTKLPDALALADNPNDIYLDYEEVKKVDENIVTKLSDAFNGFIEKLKGVSPAAPALTDDERKKLSEIDAVKTQLDQAMEKIKLAEGRIKDTENVAWAAQVDNRIKDLVAQGIPPAMCLPVKTILLANPAAASTMIKLADDKEISLADQMYAALEALPPDHRIKMSQIGSQESPEPQSQEAIKKMADEDVKAMGGKVTDDGKYIL
jgi:hypothetical protein